MKSAFHVRMVDILAFACQVANSEREQDADCAIERYTGKIGNDIKGDRGRPLGRPDYAEGSRQGNVIDVVAG